MEHAKPKAQRSEGAQRCHGENVRVVADVGTVVRQEVEMAQDVLMSKHDLSKSSGNIIGGADRWTLETASACRSPSVQQLSFSPQPATSMIHQFHDC